MFKKQRKILAAWWRRTGKPALVRWHIWPPEKETVFLLPETAEEYRRILARAIATCELIRENRHRLAIDLANRLETAREWITRDASEVLSPIYRVRAERSRRMIDSLASQLGQARRESRRLWVRDPCDRAIEGTLSEWAEKEARRWEWSRIVRGGESIYVSLTGKHRAVVIYKGIPFLYECDDSLENLLLALDGSRDFSRRIVFLVDSLAQASEMELQAVEEHFRATPPRGAVPAASR